MMRQSESFQQLMAYGEENKVNKKGQSLLSCNEKCWWWSPPQNTLSVAFCNETSIHGLKFLGQDKRHISERIFWLVGFCCSFGMAIYLIYSVWDLYEKAPVIVSFQAREQGMDTLPFPAVTICNMNKFPITKVKQLEAIVQNPAAPLNDRKLAKKQLIFVNLLGIKKHYSRFGIQKFGHLDRILSDLNNVCNAQQSVAKEFDFAFQRGSTGKKSNNQQSTSSEPNNETIIAENGQAEMTDFLIQYTIPCYKLIRLCMLGEKIRDCRDIFKPIVTDYGKCCTFNILPLPMLTKNPGNEGKINASLYDNPVLGSTGHTAWPQEELTKWENWNYDEGFVLDGSSRRPWRQRRAGLPYGLSVLVDPNLDDYYCPASDSEGMRYILHTPLEMPRVMEFSSVIHMEKEIVIEVHPDVTNADDDIRQIDPEKRLCYFGKEKKLQFFGPYTAGNCMDECMGNLLAVECNCSLAYMPREAGVRTCDSDPKSKDSRCMDDARKELQAHLKEVCPKCYVLCEDIVYNYETTVAELQNSLSLWGDPDPSFYPNGPPDWVSHKMSVVHIFFGAEATVPKLRQRMYGITDLIANTGGILGLCLGFSILSGVEVIYFITLRSFWKYCRKRMQKRNRQQQQQQGSKCLTQMIFQKPSNKVIKLNPNGIPLYSNNIASNIPPQGYQMNEARLPPPPPLVNTRWGKWGNSQGHHFYDASSFKSQASNVNSMSMNGYAPSKNGPYYH